MTHMMCFLCGTFCEMPSRIERDCSRCGHYEVPHLAELLVGRIPGDQLRALRGWVCTQNRNGVIPTINRAAIDRFRNPRMPSIPERVNLLVQEAFRRQESVGDQIDFADPRFLSVTYSDDRKEIGGLLQLASEKGWIIADVIPGASQGRPVGHLTLAGYVATEELLDRASRGQQAFVGMWFDESMTAARQEGIVPGIEDAGYVPMVIDRKEHIRKIDDEIIAEIRRSRFMVADFTHGDQGARGSVYYEAGFAAGLGIPVIGTCRQDRVGDIHFDRRQYNHILWETPDELRRRLSRRISAVIGDGPNKRIP